MNVLLDTHILIWYIEGNESISLNARYIIGDADNKKFVSLASFYEMAIKIKISKLSLKLSLNKYLDILHERDISILPIAEQHIISYQVIPLIDNHRDPFDRLLIATAFHERLTIITADKQFLHYQDIVNIVW